MKTGYSLFVFLLFMSVEAIAQKPKSYPEAPEKWSRPEPIRVISDSFARAESPSVTADGKILYFGYIWVTHLTDIGWSTPKLLPKHITAIENIPEHPVVSPNGKRLFFTWWTGAGWFAFYSDWDSTINDWGPVQDPGPRINGLPDPDWGAPGADAGCFLDDTTLIVLKHNMTFISHWHSTTATWDSVVMWPYSFPDRSWDGFSFIADCGIAVTPDRKKVYSSPWSRADTTIDGKYYDNYDIFVCYRDTTDTTNRIGYGKYYALNFCIDSDSLYFRGEYASRFEGFPAITGDGKTLFFTADYQGKYTIYVSHLIVDENGDSVTDAVNQRSPDIPFGFKLYPAYPNPFNPTTTIAYSVPTRTNIRITVYDILGRRVRVLKEGAEVPGQHQVLFDSTGLASGTYILLFETPAKVFTSKVMLIK